MQQYLFGILQVFTYSLLGILLSWLTFKAAHFLFNISLIDEIRSGNKAAAYFSLGIFILLGLIIGLVKA